MADTFFITTAIDYTNGAPHIGHAYEKILADVIARYHRLKGEQVFFLTGVDQHGQKVQQSAEKQGVAPQQFVDDITKKFVALWDKLDVRYDRWAATTDPLHKQCVQKILQRLWDEKKIYKDKQGGYYSIRQEQFLTDKERGPDGQFGPEWGEVEFREEENYYFKLAEHKDWLLGLIDKRSGENFRQNLQNKQNSENSVNSVSSACPFVVPEFRVAELRNAVEKLTGDLCVSRPKSRLAWGIEFPFDPDYVTYVWFDALVNYISFAGYDPDLNAETQRREENAETNSANLRTSAPLRFKELWPALHVIGKDIMIPAHGVYWPIMLHSLGFTDDQIPPLLVHGWWNISGAKMSKSTGNSIDPDALADKYGAEALRYYLMSDIATGKDADFSEERLVGAYNTALANGVGNLLNRAVNMAAKYREGKIVGPPGEQRRIQFKEPISGRSRFDPKDEIDLHIKLYVAAMDQHAVNDGLAAALGLAVAMNFYVDVTAPWKMAKDVARAEELDCVLYTLAESLRIIAILISPILPKAARGIFDQLDPEQKLSRDFRLEDARWGVLEDGHVVGKPVPLFPRIEAPAA